MVTTDLLPRKRRTSARKSGLPIMTPVQPETPSAVPARPTPRHNGMAGHRLRILTAISVALTAVGCTPPGPRAPESATDPLRLTLAASSAIPYPISYLRAGTPGGPRLVLVHGTPGSANAWADYLLDVPEGWEVVALDRPGFGRSGPESAVVGIAEQAAAVAALLPQDLRPVVLLGHSMGGPVIAHVAAAHPGRIVGLVMLAASLDPELEEVHPLQRVGAWGPVRAMLPRVLLNSNAELLALQTELRQLAPMLPRITAKVVIVHGTRDDLVPVANVDFMQANLGGARCVRTILLEGHNHFLPWNSAATVREAVRMALEPAC